MAKNFMWCGYLEAGAKSSPVVIDQRLETGNPETMYVFNLARNEILPYSRSIVEPKLRELRDDETDIVNDLKNAFAKARRGFKLRSEPVVQANGRRQKADNERPPRGEGDFVPEDVGVEFEAVSDDDWGSDDSED